ncbi:hypothetical protein RRG08_059619, partial [Elysia crispata]
PLLESANDRHPELNNVGRQRSIDFLQTSTRAPLISRPDIWSGGAANSFRRMMPRQQMLPRNTDIAYNLYQRCIVQNQNNRNILGIVNINNQYSVTDRNEIHDNNPRNENFNLAEHVGQDNTRLRYIRQEEAVNYTNNDIDLRNFGDSYKDIDIQNPNPRDLGLPNRFSSDRPVGSDPTLDASIHLSE